MPAFGRLVEHDPRSRDYPFHVATPKPLRDTFWTDAAPILDQGNIGGCVGWTGADVLNTDVYEPLRRAKNGGRYFTDDDGLRFYELATHLDNIAGSYPQDGDTGSSGLGLAKALKRLGLIDRYTHAFSWDAFVQAILRGPVAVGTPWTERMTAPDNGGVARVGPLNGATIAGGHEWMCRGISFTHNLILGRNHWTSGWCTTTDAQKMPGEFWVTITDAKRLLAYGGDATVLHGVGMP